MSKSRSSIRSSKAVEFLRKAAAALRGKVAVLRARLLFLASLRRRAAVLAGISRHIRALAPRGRHQERAAAPVVLSRPAPDHHAGVVSNDDNERDVAVGMAALASLFEEVVVAKADNDGGHLYRDWTRALNSLFGDDEETSHSHACGDGLDSGKGDGLEEEDDDDDETSVIDLIRSRREGEGREFKLDDEIDRAADMFITRIRRRRRMAVHPDLVS